MTQAPPDLAGLVRQGRTAMAAPLAERVHACLSVLPLLVEALDYVATRQAQLREIRAELTMAVRELREKVWEAQRTDPNVTYMNANVHRALLRVNQVLDRLDKVLTE